LSPVGRIAYHDHRAEVAELADARDLGSRAERRKGSTPFLGNSIRLRLEKGFRMSSRRRDLLVALIACGFLSPAADAQTTLRLRFEKGKTNSYVVTQTTKIEQTNLGQSIVSTVKQSMQFTMTCDGVEDNGNGRITTRFERARMEVEAPDPIGKFAVDSAEPVPDNPTAAGLAPVVKILGSLEFATVVTPRGETVDFKIPDETLKKLRAIPGAAQFGGGLFTEEGIKTSLGQSKLLLPQEKVGPGAKWNKKIVTKLSFGKLSGEVKYVYQGDDGKFQKIGYEPVLSIEPSEDTRVSVKLESQKGSGVILFDNALGRVQEMSLHDTMELGIGNAGVNLTQKMDHTMTMKLKEK
jgi:hypothetical protein